MHEAQSNEELVSKVSEALAGRGVNVTDEQMQDVDYLTGQMEKLPQFVAYETEEIRTAVTEAIKKV